MSDQRYSLEHTGRRGAGETRGGLSLLVRDDWSGESRDPATLSGGETFVVSLALALGLADVITHEAGGADLDTLFVDEGFGSLDADTLDDVMDTLDSLRDGGRVVGVVSHVAEMRDRIPTQLRVEQGPSRARRVETVTRLTGRRPRAADSDGRPTARGRRRSVSPVSLVLAKLTQRGDLCRPAVSQYSPLLDVDAGSDVAFAVRRGPPGSQASAKVFHELARAWPRSSTTVGRARTTATQRVARREGQRPPRGSCWIARTCVGCRRARDEPSSARGSTSWRGHRHAARSPSDVRRSVDASRSGCRRSRSTQLLLVIRCPSWPRGTQRVDRANRPGRASG